MATPASGTTIAHRGPTIDRARATIDAIVDMLDQGPPTIDDGRAAIDRARATIANIVAMIDRDDDTIDRIDDVRGRNRLHGP